VTTRRTARFGPFCAVVSLFHEGRVDRNGDQTYCADPPRTRSVCAMSRGRLRRLESRAFRVAVERLGAQIDNTWILEVPGRRTGVPHFTPVKLLDVDAEQFLVSLYGPSDWSRNLRASRTARLRQKGRSLFVAAEELAAAERPRILRAYLASATRSKTLDILGGGRRDPDEAQLRRIAANHPVFRLAVAEDQESAPRSGSRIRDSSATHRPSIDRSLRRAIRAHPAEWALVSGISGLTSGAFLILFFGIARPFSGQPSPWSWLGPANDLTSAVQAAALVPVALALRGLMPDETVRRWTVVGIVAMAAATVLPVLLVTGVLPFAVQAPMVTFFIAVMFCWLYAVSRAGGRKGVLPSPVARAGMGTSLAVGAAGVVGALSLLLPARSAARYAGFALAAVPGILGWLGFPAWTLLLRRVLLGVPESTTLGAAELGEELT
jgi:deazaflavin-dependent oxidoreductase (nitroreductase family)